MINYYNLKSFFVNGIINYFATYCNNVSEQHIETLHFSKWCHWARLRFCLWDTIFQFYGSNKFCSAPKRPVKLVLWQLFISKTFTIRRKDTYRNIKKRIENSSNFSARVANFSFSYFSDINHFQSNQMNHDVFYQIHINILGRVSFWLIIVVRD